MLVASGTHTGVGNKNLDFGGVDRVLMSEEGAEVTVIDCEDEGRGFCFHNRETPVTVVEGLTIKNGWTSNPGSLRDWSKEHKQTIFARVLRTRDPSGSETVARTQGPSRPAASSDLILAHVC